MPLSLWICAVITLISAIVSTGYAVAGWRDASGAARTASAYGLSRSTSLLIAAIAALAVGAPAFVAAIAVAMTLVQAFDAWVGTTIRDPWKTYGPTALAILNAAALLWALAA